MALDYAILLDPIYASLGVSATLIPRAGPTQSVELLVIDKTTGVSIAPPGASVELDTFAPVAAVRVSELTSKKVDVANVDDGKLIMSGKTWRVKSCQFRPTPDGVGEIYMVLVEEDGEEAAA